MAELPEITRICTQMDETLRGKQIADIHLLQEKCTNVPEGEMRSRTDGAIVTGIRNKGKWIILSLNNGEHILISFGMGADILYFQNESEVQEKYQVRVSFSDGSGFTIRFWWFGKFFLAHEKELVSEPNTKDIAITPFHEAFTYDYFKSLLAGKKGQIKSLLLDQKIISGIGNMYMHDILFKAGVHPKKKISDMQEEEVRRLFDSIIDLLRFYERNGTFSYEKDFFGQRGKFTGDNFLVGYREGSPCPVCESDIILIKTGSTSSYLCPECQKI